MVGQVSPIGANFYINYLEFNGNRLNNVCSNFHIFLMFNYLFHLNDFHDGSYASCSMDNKFKLLIFDLWMNPFKIRSDDVISFSGNPSYDKFHHCNSSFAYYPCQKLHEQ